MEGEGTYCYKPDFPKFMQGKIKLSSYEIK